MSEVSNPYRKAERVFKVIGKIIGWTILAAFVASLSFGGYMQYGPWGLLAPIVVAAVLAAAFWAAIGLILLIGYPIMAINDAWKKKMQNWDDRNL